LIYAEMCMLILVPCIIAIDWQRGNEFIRNRMRGRIIVSWCKQQNIRLIVQAIVHKINGNIFLALIV